MVLLLSMVVTAGLLSAARTQTTIPTTNDEFMRNMFSKHSIVPDLVDVLPSDLIQLTYSGGLTVTPGEELTPAQVADQPNATWPVPGVTNLTVPLQVDPAQMQSLLFTLSMSGPVAIFLACTIQQINLTALRSLTGLLNVPLLGSFEFICEFGLILCWTVDLDAPSRANPTFRSICHWLVVNIPFNDIAKGNTLVHYRGPHPHEGSGLHRYVLLLYRQKGPLLSLPLGMEKDRRDFSIHKFALDRSLGNPVAGNFFIAQFNGSNSTTNVTTSS